VIYFEDSLFRYSIYLCDFTGLLSVCTLQVHDNILKRQALFVNSLFTAKAVFVKSVLLRVF